MSPSWALLGAWSLLSEPARADDDVSGPDLIYFAMVDRFANGAPDSELDVDISDPQGFHGGDLQGVIDHLDHLQAMGIRTLWLSPLFQSQIETAGQWGPYHGYWITDHLAMDPRYGTFELLAQLSNDLHSRGMRLVLDMVYNHVGYSSTLPETHPDWFHETGDILNWSDPVQRRTHRVHGLPDLDQNHPEVFAYLSQATRVWLEKSQADGLRIDAMGHMEPEFIAHLRKELGDAPPWLLGEDFQGDPVALSKTVQSAELDAIFDFPLYYAMTDVFCSGQPMGRLASILSLDRLLPEGTERITFLDNHDLPRIATRCGSRPDGVKLALHALFSLRGTPSITYGTEVPMTGAEEPSNRKDMPWDAPLPLVPEIARLQALRAMAPNGPTTDQILYLDEESLMLLRTNSSESQLVLIHLGDEELLLDWPEVLVDVQLNSTSVFAQDTLQIQENSERPVRINAPARSVSQWFMSPGGYQISKAVTLSYIIVDAPDLPELEVVIVGGGPELGNWNPTHGLKLTQKPDGHWGGSVSIPAGSAIAWHPVLIRPGEEPQWEAGADHFTWVPRPGTSPVEPVLLTAEHQWRATVDP